MRPSFQLNRFSSLQLFGAMGFTWENDLQFALKRAKAGELMLGGTAEHRARVTEEYKAKAAALSVAADMVQP